MSLKQHDHRELDKSDSSTALAEDSWSGPWGIIAPSNQVVRSIRFCKDNPETGRESYSYPYHAIIRWHWMDGEKETLEIKVAGDVITILGHGLEKLVDALEFSRLQVVVEQISKKSANNDGKLQIYSITVERPSSLATILPENGPP